MTHFPLYPVRSPLDEWTRATQEHIEAYGRPLVLFSGPDEPMDDYHREMLQKWLAASDYTIEQLDHHMGRARTVSQFLTDLMAEFGPQFAQLAREARLVMMESDYFAQFSGEDEDEG